jgi:N,N'-diacetyllegionaminate synthase
MYRNARRSIVAACAIPAGTAITAAMLTVKRPGFGIVPKHLPLVVGRIAKVDIPQDEIVTWEMV